ncbi:hypothetical protein PAXRUDRAFT_147488 [Paxillus rubicundulus Ve08.2h10]|uniref:Uncharacterized protein n=1 Tax=Paxillus rubicundulus Ve08.2h10 TaxID=930991 RepID=A0A0D0DZD2_9AGAM|nr:hypothetical protein PAXRUDRAFT_147488 [Paxillus rubicundulus Ve08.2h10]
MNTTTTNPLTTEPQTKNHTSADIHHFFKKCKGQETICMHCMNMKEEDPDHFPLDRMYTYSQNTSNTSLCG